MQGNTKRERQETLTRPDRASASEQPAAGPAGLQVPDGTAGAAMAPSASWDPYHVWLTRVRAPRSASSVPAAGASGSRGETRRS